MGENARPSGGTGRYWDHEDCPHDDCDGELSQQDRFNVMCLSCERVWTHYKTESKHKLQTADFETVAEKPRVATDGGETPTDGGSQPVEREAVLERLDELREDSKRADRVYRYVESAHDEPAAVTDLLGVLRADGGLALEIRLNTGRRVICAVEIDGEARYPTWYHSAVAARSGRGDVRVRSVDRRHEVKEALEDRYPRVRLRSETPLADLEEAASDDRTGLRSHGGASA
jgi:hypothetical protein